MKAEPRLSQNWLVASFIAVAIWSLASSVYSWYSLKEVRSQAESLTGNALPSIEALTMARADLRHLDVAFDHYLMTGTQQARATLGQIVGEMERDVTAYLALPTFPGERERHPELTQRIDRMNRTLWRAVSERAPDGNPVAHGSADPVHVAVGQVDDAFHDLILFNSQQAHDAMVRSEEARRRSERVPLLIDLLDVVLAALVALLGVRAIRRYTRFRAEHEALLAQRADELEQFAGRVAHDIRNPLNAISLCLDLISKAPQPDGKAAGWAERGRSAMQRVNRIVEGLYQFARAGARPQAGSHADLGALLADAASDARPQAEAAEIDLHIEPGQEVQVACNPGVLTSVLTNLLHNAIKYMGDSPVRRITARVQTLPQRVRVEIEDTGPGIPADLQDTIFEPYIRAPGAARSQPGIGLGLATVKRIVQAHHGTVGVRSVLGQGSVFWFELPAAAHGGAEPGGQGGQGTVLTS